MIRDHAAHPPLCIVTVDISSHPRRPCASPHPIHPPMSSPSSSSPSHPLSDTVTFDDVTLDRLWQYVAENAAAVPAGTPHTAVYNSAAQHMREEFNVYMALGDVKAAIARARVKARRRKATVSQTASRTAAREEERRRPAPGRGTSAGSLQRRSLSLSDSLASVGRRRWPPAQPQLRAPPSMASGSATDD